MKSRPVYDKDGTEIHLYDNSFDSTKTWALN